MLLLEQADREDIGRQLAAIEAAAYPWMEQRTQARVVHDLRWALMDKDEQVAHVEGNWAALRHGRGLPARPPVH